MTRTVEQVTDVVTYHGEGPCWWPGWGGLRWVDMLAGDVLSLRADGTVDRVHVGEVAAFLRPRSSGGWVVAVERGLALGADPEEVPDDVQEIWSDPGVRMNDGGCDPFGALYAGSMAYDAAEGAATLYRVDPRRSVSVALAGVTISNGFAVDPSGRRAYYNDSATGRTDVLDVTPEGVGGRRPFHRVPAGSPDGLAVDSAGNVWTAVHGQGVVVCVSPSGEVLERVPVPVAQVTACAFGGPELRDLYVTTSRENLDDPEPAAGALFRARVDVPGLPVLPFGG
ncbi:SMP-30/gluconolactonase/LRE family protein [Actinotalea sp. AC32]|nr:SMP-30/gluconolactonase/LRE family protein [Actinotalea sp. AC32]